MRSGWVLGVIAAVVGCKQDAATPPATGPAASQPANDALWALAPDRTVAALVASPRAIALAERGWLAITDVLGGSRELAELYSKVMHAANAAVGTPTPTLAALGLSADRGLAVFTTESGGTVAVLPVGDRDKLLAQLHGTKGKDGDTLLDATCKPIAGDYVCALPAALLDSLGKAKLDAVRNRAGGRGDIEMVFVAPRGPTMAAYAQLEPGGAVVSGAITGVPPDALAKLGVASALRPGAAGAAGFGQLDLAPHLATVPAVPLLPEVTASAAAVTFTGPIQYVLAPGTGIDLRAPLSDPGPIGRLIEGCAKIPSLAALGATGTGGTCTVTVPQIALPIDAWLEGKELRVGKRGQADAPLDLAATALGRALAASPWSIAFYSRGTLFSLRGAPGMADDPALTGGALAAVRATSILNEVGFGIRVDGDTVRFTAGLRTAWANPGDLADQLLALPAGKLYSAATAAKVQALAAAAPSAPFASDLRAGVGGAYGLVAPIGVVASVAVPAFMDYLKRAR